MRARGDLFPSDHGLVFRMVVVGLLTPLLVLGALAAVMLLLSSFTIRAVVIGALCVGAWVAIRERVEASSRGRRLHPADAPELHAIVERLCVVADLPKPTIVLDSRAMPNSWVEGTRRRGFRLHLTQGLLDLLEPRELEAVVAHELSPVVNRDAAVMIGGVIASGIGWAGSLGTRTLSRYREFAADEGAVALTGSPAALASALMKVSDGLVAMPKRDLREASLHDAFHLLPAARESAYGLPNTHPPLRARIERLERLEHSLHRH